MKQGGHLISILVTSLLDTQITVRGFWKNGKGIKRREGTVTVKKWRKCAPLESISPMVAELESFFIVVCKNKGTRMDYIPIFISYV